MNVNIIISLFVLLFISIPLSAQDADAHHSEVVEYSWHDYDDWYNKKSPDYNGWKYIVLHHSATSAGSVKSFHKFHTKQGYGGIAYHFVIGNGKGMKDGQVQETFRWKQQISGTHVSVNSWDYNVFGIGICLVGNLENASPTKAQVKAMKRLIFRLKTMHHIKSQYIFGHNQIKHDDKSGKKEQTACPGKKLDLKNISLK